MKSSVVEKMALFVSENWKGWPDEQDLHQVFSEMLRKFDLFSVIRNPVELHRFTHNFINHIVNQNSGFYYPLHDIKYALMDALDKEGVCITLQH